ncbi:MAG: hypothetical protein JST61_10830 [Acidobacteria bacterium]|nr:hypothetical protein [Acidobacteriota bacterium]
MKLNRLLMASALCLTLSASPSAFASEHGGGWFSSFFSYCNRDRDRDRDNDSNRDHERHKRECDQNGQDSGRGNNCDRGKGNGGGYCGTGGGGTSSGGGSGNTSGGGPIGK